MLTNLVTFLAQAVVSNPDQVSVESADDDSRVSININVAPDDYGRVIGRNGQTIGAIRRIAQFAGSRKGLGVFVDVVDASAVEFKKPR